MADKKIGLSNIKTIKQLAAEENQSDATSVKELTDRVADLEAALPTHEAIAALTWD